VLVLLSTLALLVTGLSTADNPYATIATDDLAVTAKLLD
jgi:hypothetical protein